MEFQSLLHHSRQRLPSAMTNELFTLLCISILFLSACTPKAPYLANALRDGYRSPELFTIAPGGIMEFDLVYEQGAYHLFYSGPNQPTLTGVIYRTADTIDDLVSAPDVTLGIGYYPSVIFENGNWHLWVWDPGSEVTMHYTAQSPTGPYTFSDNLPDTGKADPAIFKNPLDSEYYLAYKNISSRKVDIYRSDSVNGQWSDLGLMLEPMGSGGWYAIEEADPKLFFLITKYG